MKSQSRPDYASIIKQSVMMHDVVSRYTTERIVRDRIRCPVHNGADRNMRVYPNSYYCWVCHATGDVIQFVQSVTGDSFQDAMRRLNQDFNLNLPLDGEPQTEADRKALDNANREIAQRRIQQIIEDADALIAGKHEANMAGLVHDTDLIIKRYAPYNGWSRWRADWCEALRVRTELLEEVK